MTSTTTNTTDDVSSEVALLGAIVFPVTKTTAILADLIFVIAKGTIQSGKLAELVALVIVLTFGGRRCLQRS